MKRIGNIDDYNQLLIIDAIRLSFEMEKTLYKNLWRILRIIEKTNEDIPPVSSQVLNAIQYVWQIIDTTNRIRGLAEQVKGLSHSQVEYQLFIRSTIFVENFRNFYQHLDNEIPKISEPARPIIGVITWVTKNPHASRTITYGSLVSGMSFHSLAFDTWENKFAAKLEFSSNQMSIYIDKIHERLIAFSLFFENWLAMHNYLLQGQMTPSSFSIRF